MAIHGDLKSCHRVRVIITDVNDAPRFASKLYETAVYEGSVLRFEFTLTDEDDPDSANGTVTPYLESNLFAADYNSSRGKGWIISVQELDFETQQHHSLQLFAQDSGQPRLKTRFPARLDVAVLDRNEFRPEFVETSYEATVSENVFESVVVLNSTDRDGGSIYGEVVSYYIPSPFIAPFNVTSRGHVYNTRLLDFESDQLEHRFSVVAVDGGGFESNAVDVTIYITNVNDNRPRFPDGVTDDAKFVEIEWDRPPSSDPVITLKAGDDDHTDVLYYYMPIGYHNFPFSLPDPLVGAIVQTADLKAPPGSAYNFSVLVQDRERASESSDVLRFHWPVSIILIDTNDPPYYLEDDITISVDFEALFYSENKRILSVQAQDDDYIHSNYSEIVSYNIQSYESLPIAIDSLGVVTLTDDRELPVTVTFNVSATDGGGLISIKPARVMVNVLYRNAHSPVLVGFEEGNSYTTVVDLKETQPNGSVVVVINVTDNDMGPDGMVKMFSLPHPHFKTSPNGTIYLTKMVDYERLDDKTFNVTVIASDSGKIRKTASGTVIIRVLNENDSPPQVTFPHSTFRFSTGTILNVSSNVTYTDDDDPMPQTHTVVFSLHQQRGPRSPFTGRFCQAGVLAPVPILCMEQTTSILTSKVFSADRFEGEWGAVRFSKMFPGNCSRFDGSKHFMLMKMTVQTWIRIGPAAMGTIFTLHRWDSYYLLAIRLERKSRITVRYRLIDGVVNSHRFLLKKPYLIDNNQWHHLVVAINYPNISLYVDGQKQESHSAVKYFSSFSGDRVCIGVASKVGDRQLTGRLAGLSLGLSAANQLDVGCMMNCGEAIGTVDAVERVSVVHSPGKVTFSSPSSEDMQAALRHIGYVNRHLDTRDVRRWINVDASDGVNTDSKRLRVDLPRGNFYSPTFLFPKVTSVFLSQGSVLVSPSLQLQDMDGVVSPYNTLVQLDASLCDRNSYDVDVQLQRCGATRAVNLLPRNVQWTRHVPQRFQDFRYWFHFNATNRVDIPSTVLPTEFIGAYYSILAWVYLETPGVIFRKGSPDGEVISVLVRKRAVEISVWTDEGFVTLQWDLPVLRQTWHHLCFTVANSSSARLYLDGHLLPFRKHIPSSSPAQAAPETSIGGNSTHSGSKRRQPFQGKLAAFAVVIGQAVDESNLRCLLACRDRLLISEQYDRQVWSVRSLNESTALRIYGVADISDVESMLRSVSYDNVHDFPRNRPRRVQYIVENEKHVTVAETSVAVRSAGRRLSLDASYPIKRLSRRETLGGYPALYDVTFLHDSKSQVIDMVSVELTSRPHITIPFTGVRFECEVALNAAERNLLCVDSPDMVHLLSAPLLVGGRLVSLGDFTNVLNLSNASPADVRNAVVRGLTGKLFSANEAAFTTFIKQEGKDEGFVFACVEMGFVSWGIEIDSSQKTIKFVHTPSTKRGSARQQAYTVFTADIDDGKWHHLTLNVRNRVVTLHVDDTTLAASLHYIKEGNRVTKQSFSTKLPWRLRMSTICNLYVGYRGPNSPTMFSGSLWGLSILPGQILSDPARDCLRFKAKSRYCLEELTLPHLDDDVTNILQRHSISMDTRDFGITLWGPADQKVYQKIINEVVYANWALRPHPRYQTRTLEVYATDHGGRFISNNLRITIMFTK
ncbi:uncharacterized protein LOC134192364 [Corticium candelabrum]|uniref:uncharacterized protein LOC134192364 n=1 Tax=Corticium candelabrum TaxID=121492 RepID=UPI002E2539CB|nr:uncharacterized protein LOC134192364 [Corticium candelabrum]